jgi:DNA segregation ATPase FtsK/SpoIIIE, S-DNA-T family
MHTYFKGCLAALIGCALLTYHADDAAWSTTGTHVAIFNQAGIVGAYVADIFFLLLGKVAYALPMVVLSKPFLPWLASCVSLACLLNQWFWMHGVGPGGMIGHMMDGLVPMIGYWPVCMGCAVLTLLHPYRVAWHCTTLKKTTIKRTLRAPKIPETVIVLPAIPVALPEPIAHHTRDLPDASLLDRISEKTVKVHAEFFKNTAKEVERVLSEFGIPVQVAHFLPGPIVTCYELALTPGMKASRITVLSKDLARALSVQSVRILEVMPGKSHVGLEIPNRQRETIHLTELFNSDVYANSASPLTLAIGKDIAGRPMIADLAKMPHLLVAGTTGSGKSVGMNAMILSILFKASPLHVRFVMIDPKMLELSVYNHIPHLLTPVVTDMKEAANALQWCVTEMERRYRWMAFLGVRNINGFNDKIRSQQQPILYPITPNEAITLEPIPFIVVWVDEFADLMMTSGKQVEERIARIAQKARAAGIHLVLATQRPSVDVVTGLIKANIPCRMAFQVSSKIDSKIILDQQGAESLLGHGDMLYVSAGSSHPIRAHGAFVSDTEVHRVVAFWKTQGAPHYIPAVTTTTTPTLTTADDTDTLYTDALTFLKTSRRISTSGLQRQFKIGYNRAARLMDTFETNGVVSAPDHMGNRTFIE